MTPQRREIVIEYERIQLIRKRAKTESELCPRCNAIADFVRVADAASLFEIKVDDIISFANRNGCHYRYTGDQIRLCLPSLLKCFRTKAISNEIKLIRGEK